MLSSSGTFSSRNRAVGQAQREKERETSADPFLQLPRIRLYRKILSSALWCLLTEIVVCMGRREQTIRKRRKALRMLLGGSPDVLVRGFTTTLPSFWLQMLLQCSFRFLSNVIKRTERIRSTARSKNTLFDKLIKCRGLLVAAELPHRQANFLTGGHNSNSRPVRL